MHSGFLAVRDELPQNIRARIKLEPGQLSDACRKQIARIDEIWTDCRKKYSESGEWLFGQFSIADIIYMPVALRFVTYSIPVSKQAREFVDAVQGLESVQQWIEASGQESESIEFIDKLVPAESSPLTLG
jgi:glutathione S-transferase